MFDTVIVGGGASGLFSAVLLSRAGKKVLVVEAQSRAGKKLALCGGGSCNVGPVERESAELAARYVRYAPHSKTGLYREEPVRQLKTLYFEYPPELVKTLWTSQDTVCGSFLGLGIALREEEGRLYPERFDAPGLASELCARAAKSGATFRYDSKVRSVSRRDGGGFDVALEDGSTVSAGSVILSSGGFSYPAIGGSDSGNGILAGLGLSVHPGTPAMGPIPVKNWSFAASSGTVVSARVSLRTEKSGKELLRTPVDKLLFTHRGLSGPVILDVCAAVHACAAEKPFLVLDLLPETGMEELAADMQALAREHPRKQALQFLTARFTRVLSAALLDKAGIADDALSADISKAAMQRLSALVKAFTVEPELPAPRNEAMSWTGGCDPAELDFATMESNKIPGLHVIGDMVSMCRPCGGYSLWFCWTSALAASKKIAYTD